MLPFSTINSTQFDVCIEYTYATDENPILNVTYISTRDKQRKAWIASTLSQSGPNEETSNFCVGDFWNPIEREFNLSVTVLNIINIESFKIKFTPRLKARNEAKKFLTNWKQQNVENLFTEWVTMLPKYSFKIFPKGQNDSSFMLKYAGIYHY